QERQGVIWAFIGDGEAPPLETDVPPEFLEPGLRVWSSPAPVRQGDWRMAIEGGVDPSHAYYLHRFADVTKRYWMPGSRGKHWVEIDDRYLHYFTEESLFDAEFPGLGRWPRRLPGQKNPWI